MYLKNSFEAFAVLTEFEHGTISHIRLTLSMLPAGPFFLGSGGIWNGAIQNRFRIEQEAECLMEQYKFVRMKGK